MRGKKPHSELTISRDLAVFPKCRRLGSVIFDSDKDISSRGVFLEVGVAMLNIAMSTIIALCLVVIPSPAKGQSSKEAEANQWVLEHYDQVVGELLPDVPKETNTGRDTQWVLSVRVYDPQRPEFWFFIRKNYTSAIRATIRVPEGESIYVQLGELWQAAPTDSPESLAKKVRLKEYNWTSDKVPELRKLVTEFESVKIGAEVSDTFLSDPVVYHFRIGSRSGEEMRVTSHGPGPLPTPARQPNSLIQFVEDFRRFMDKQIRTENDKQ